ncbi:hypothetical protein ABFA07_007144 [Porites harrisoni]
MNCWIIIPTLACTIVVIVRSAPQWGYMPYEYFHEFYDHYGEDIRNNIDHIQQVHEKHHENQHVAHEKFQEHYYDFREKHQEGSEHYQESLERAQEDQRSTTGTEKKHIISHKVTPQISAREANSFLQK